MACCTWFRPAVLLVPLALMTGGSNMGCAQWLGIDELQSQPPDASIVVSPDAALRDAAPDADPAEPRIMRLDPPRVPEGAGCIPVAAGCRADSRPVPIVIHGADIRPGAEVVVTGPGFPAPGTTLGLTVAAGGDMAAFALSVPVLPALGEADMPSLTVTLRQGLGQADVPLPLDSLDDFVASVDAPGGTFNAAMLRDRYARIDIDAPVRFTGTGTVRLIATSELVVQAALRADGQNASGGTRGLAGPGGCDGGAAQAAGGCEGGGRAGTGAGGGGGGGHAEPGTNGSGAGSGTGGVATGDSFLTPLAPVSADAARGHGGGGGGLSCSLVGTGGGGGGGGGTVEITSHGLLRLTSTALLSARGGNGGVGNCNLGGTHGHGGGGSGGAILARAAMALTDEGTDPRVDVSPGVGGSGGSGNAGGAGSPGRVRVDVPEAGAVPPAFSVTHRYRGPMWSRTAPAIVTDINELTLALSGEPQTTVFVDIEGQSRRDLSFPADGMLAVPVMSLSPGQNQICARVTDGPHAEQPDAFNCIDVAYVPAP